MSWLFRFIFLWCVFSTGTGVLCAQRTNITLDSIAEAELYCIGNVYFDNMITNEINSAYLKDINANEERESELYNFFVSKRGVRTILLESPVHDELLLKYFFNVEIDSATGVVDTAAYPSAFEEYKRLRQLSQDYPGLRVICVDVAGTEVRYEFMNSLLFSIFSQFKPLPSNYLFPEQYGYDFYFSVWEAYNSTLDSLIAAEYNADYIELINEALEVRFFKSCNKRRVKSLVTKLKQFFKYQHPELATTYILRLCHSYVTEKRSKQDIAREIFILEEVQGALSKYNTTPVLLDMGLWHVEADIRQNLRYYLETTKIECSYIRLYQPLFHYWYSEEENELAGEVARKDVVRMRKNDYLLF